MKKVIKAREIIVEATCDICGGDCLKPIYNPNKSDGDRDNTDIRKEFEGMELKAVWGYNSNKDGEIWEAIVCEKCVDKYLKPLINFEKNIQI